MSSTRCFSSSAHLLVTILFVCAIQHTWSYKDCGDLKIICNRKDPMCCEGSCCPLLDHFQFVSDVTPDNGPFPTPEPTAPRTCANVGDQCTSAKPRGEECCAGSGTRCQFTGSDVDGNLFGTCCIPKDNKGCTVDSDCCGEDNKCLSNMCLASAVADVIGARYVSYQKQSASNGVAAAAAAAAAYSNVGQLDTVNHYDVDAIPNPKDEDTPNEPQGLKGPIEWHEAWIFAIIIISVTVSLVFVGFSPMIYRRCTAKTKRSMKEIEDLSVATVSITESDQECNVDDELML